MSECAGARAAIVLALSGCGVMGSARPGYAQQPGGYPPARQGAYGQQPPGGYPPAQQGGYGQQPPGGYPPPQQGGYGQQQPGGYPPPQQGGYAPPQQQGGYPQQPGYAPPGGYAPSQPVYQRVEAPRRERESSEIGFLYGTSVAYGVGLGVWIDAEIGIDDPATGLIAPAVLGVAAPVGVYFLDQPSMPRGMPSALAFGMLIGAGEGMGIAGYQFVTADRDSAWGFRGLSRSVALGATLGGAAGWAIGYYEEPSPKLSAFVGSGSAWGTLIGSSFAYGASEAGIGYGRANDSAALGGLIGFNVGLGATAGLSTLFVPTWHQLSWMWGGAAIGAGASLPVFLLYAGEGGPPAKRGFIFTGTAITLGTLAGGLFSSGELETESAAGERGAESAFGLTSITPLAVEGGAGVTVGGYWL